jgi:hypothetical protein
MMASFGPAQKCSLTVSYYNRGEMRWKAAPAAALYALVLSAQISQDADVARARVELERTRAMVEEGVEARTQLAAAEQAVTDAEENAFLRRTLYGQDATEQDADRMVAVTALRLERREQAIVKCQDLIRAGVVARVSLPPLVEQADRARKEHEYATTRARLIHEMAEMAREEAALQVTLERAPAEAQGLAERYDGNGTFTPGDFGKISRAFEREFSKNLPVSANGETAVHRALGFDHRNRVDVAVNPDQPEGAWLRQYLVVHHIPYFAFRAAVPGRATGPHIHIGPMSARLEQGG